MNLLFAKWREKWGEEDRLDVLQEQEFCLEKDEIFDLALEKIILLYYIYI